MNARTFGNLHRITKAAARKAYERGEAVTVLPVNANPLSPWWSTSTLQARVMGDASPRTFEAACNYATYALCTSETGRYLAYYIEGVEA